MVSGSNGVGFQSHLVLLQQVVRDVVVGVVLEVGLELVVGLEVYLAGLQHSQGLAESTGNLVAHQV
jgi:hypothetical protein